MDHQWRPSSTQGNICPVCGISHFPFCPPPPHSFSPSPRFPLSPVRHRPGFDPYHVPPVMPPHPSWRGPNDGLNDYRNLYRPDADPYGQMTPQCHYALVPNGQGDCNGFLGDGERNFKRMRVGDVSSTENYQSSAVVPSADERRLKLIRDHGNLVAAGGYNHKIGRFNADAPAVLLPSKDAGFPKNEISWSGMKSHYNGGISRNKFDSSLNEQRGYVLYPSEPSAFNAVRSPMSGTQPRMPNSLFPVGLGMPPPYPYAPYNHSTPSNPHKHHHGPNDFSPEEYVVNKQSLQPQKPPPQERKIVDASDIFKMPHRARRPDHFVIILRGLPGSGKSYLAKMLRDLEVENGGSAPRIYSMDDYFMTEVEKVEQYDASNSSSGVRGKRSTMKKVMEYCYEPEMEEAYRASMLKAYKKTLEEGVFTFVIVDDRNLRVADFAQFWAIGKKSGYEVYITEATYKDPEGCAARNVHGFTLDDIHQMVKRWEETPALYLQLNVKLLLHGDDLKESGIQEVDMEMEDEDDEGPPAIECKRLESTVEPSLACDEPRVNSQHGNLPEGSLRWDTDAETSTEVARELGRSKWSDDLEGQERPEYLNRHLSALSGLAASFSGKKGKSVRWGDEVGDTGFSIAAAKKSSKSSLVIGPGAGYNLKSNPLAALEMLGNSSKSVERMRQSVFQERLRAETESFKVVFDKRGHRIGGFEPDDVLCSGTQDRRK